MTSHLWIVIFDQSDEIVIQGKTQNPLFELSLNWFGNLKNQAENKIHCCFLLILIHLYEMNISYYMLLCYILFIVNLSFSWIGKLLQNSWGANSFSFCIAMSLGEEIFSTFRSSLLGWTAVHFTLLNTPILKNSRLLLKPANRVFNSLA